MNKRIIFMSAAIAATGVVGAVGVTTVTNAASGATSTHLSARRAVKIREEAKLSQAVSDGVITKAQKQAFNSELKALRSVRKTDITKTSTKAEREVERTKLKTELKAWATTNNFPLAKIFPQLAK